jgi:hypothetical protein
MQLGMHGGDNLMIATGGTRGIRQQGLGFRTRDWQLLIVAEGILESHTKRVLTQWISSCRAWEQNWGRWFSRESADDFDNEGGGFFADEDEEQEENFEKGEERAPRSEQEL